jgi:uncharacterized protein (TIGR00369 family)
MANDPAGSEPPPLADDAWCFACGRQNPLGLHTVWTVDASGVARTRFVPERHHQGWRGVVHGGILSTLLDEAMAQRLRSTGDGGVTANLNVRFRKPAPTGAPLLVEAALQSEARRVVRLTASVRSESGVCHAEAEGVYIRMSPEQKARGLA